MSIAESLAATVAAGYRNAMSSADHAARTNRKSVPDRGPADTRCFILDVAERLFREIGYRKTTVADIAKALRMSPANVYRFFASKKSINEAVAARKLDELDTALERIATAHGSAAADRLKHVLSAMSHMSVQLFTADRRMHEMVEAAMAESWAVVHGHIVRTEAVLSRLIAEGVSDGVFHVADPLIAARCVHSAMIRFCHPTMIVQCADEPGPTIDEMTDFILASLQAR